VALVAAAAFVVVLVAVMTGATRGLDRAATDWFRPDDVWGPTQQSLRPVIDALEPRRAYVVLVLVASVVCLQRGSRRPAVFAGLLALTSMGVTTATKVLTHRADPTGDISSTGGSFPSGHMVALTSCLGCCVLLFWRRSRWWHWVVVAVPPAVMAAALLYTAAHWVTDVLGGTLLAVATLCWAASWPLRTAMTEPARRKEVNRGPPSTIESL
jgi:membrane-associated phospholipid phosphatase